MVYNVSENELRLIHTYRALRRCEQIIVLATARALGKRRQPPAPLPAGVIDIHAKSRTA